MRSQSVLMILLATVFLQPTFAADLEAEHESESAPHTAKDLERQSKSDGNYASGALFTHINVAPGYVAYVYHTPMMNPNSQGGFKKLIKGPSADTYNWLNLQAVFVDVRPKNYSEYFTLQTKDDVQVPLRIHVILSVDETRVRELIENFSVDWYDNSVKEPIRAIVRAAIENYTLKELAEHRVAVREAIEREVNEKILSAMPIKLHAVSLGAVMNPKVLADAVEQKMAAIQRLEQQQTELKIAEEQARIATARARGQKEAQQAMSEALTPEYLTYLWIEAMKQIAVDKNNNTFLIQMGANGPTPPVVVPAPR